MIPSRYKRSVAKEFVDILGRTLITIGGRSAVTEVAKKAPLSAAAAIEATLKDFMMDDERKCKYDLYLQSLM